MADHRLSRPASHEHPATILGVSPEASPEEIRAAYLRRIKEHPPDRSPEMFERIRDAYQTLSDPRRRVEQLLLADDPDAPFERLLDADGPRRVHVGPAPWLRLLQER